MDNNATRPTLYILCGLPFSGKSTLGRAIAAHIGGAIVSFDELYSANRGELARTRDTFAVWQAVREMARERAGELLRRGVSVVYDNTNFRVAHRDAMRTVARDSGARAIVVFVDTPASVIAERRAKNAQTRQRGDIADADLAYVREWWQAPRQGEAAIVFRPDAAVGDWLRRFSPMAKQRTGEQVDL